MRSPCWRRRWLQSRIRWVRFDKRSTYYDDIAAVVARQIEQHNRVVMILQGLLDRSQVFHPHPPWRLWEPGDMAQALRLHYDADRALTGGASPDFEEYRRRLNMALKPGDMTVGQEYSWLRREAQKENARHNWSSNWHDMTLHHPYGNPGPGAVATVQKFGKGGCLYRWTRPRVIHSPWLRQSDEIACTFLVPTSELLNVSAYTPGDYRLFFDDPRTRADYLKWAPLLLAAEDWHAGRERRRRKP